MSVMEQGASKAPQRNSTLESHLTTSEVVSSHPSSCRNTWNIPLNLTWRSVTVWCTSMIHWNLLGVLFTNTTVYAHRLFSFTTPNKRLTLCFYWFGLNHVWSPLYDFHSVHSFSANCWYSNPSFQDQCCIIKGWIVVSIETRSSDFSK